MTEGIIQKVFEKWTYKTHNWTCIYTQDMKDLEQELIKEIKALKVSMCGEGCGYCYAQNINIYKLIGETKE